MARTNLRWLPCALGLGLLLSGCPDDAITPGGSGDVSGDIGSGPGIDGLTGIGGQDTSPDAAVDAGGITCGKDGDPCDDGDPCTVGDACVGGACQGTAKSCDDGLACTADACVGGACESTVAAGSCAVGGACYADGDPDPGNECLVCSPADNAFVAADGAACGGDPCTVGTCAGGVCSATLDCDDANPCTDDACLEGACSSVPNEAACDDGNACTTEDACAGGTCGGAVAGDCAADEDCGGDPLSCVATWTCTAQCVCEPDQVKIPPQGPPGACATQTCDKATGEWETELHLDGTPCDDVDPCTTGDHCEAGQCKGGASLVCNDGQLCTADVCEPGTGCVAAPYDGGECEGCKAQRMTSILFGKEGEGLDIDGDGTIDNAFAPLAPLANPALDADVQAGAFTWLAQHAGFDPSGAPYVLNVLHGDSTPCPQGGTGCYEVKAINYEPDCSPKFRFDNATLTGDHLSAGGPGTTVTARFTLVPGVLGEYLLTDVVVDATLEVKPGLGLAISGTIAGAVSLEQVKASIEPLDDKDLPVPKATLLALLDATIVPDVDADGDGVMESASFALLVAGSPAQIPSVEDDVCPTCSSGPCVFDGETCLGCQGRKVVAMSIAPPESAPDLDGDGSGDSAFAPFSGLLDPVMSQAVQSGQLIWLPQLVGAGMGPEPFTINIVHGTLAAGAEGCQVQTDVCAYDVGKTSYDGAACVPKLRVDNAVVDPQGHLVAGGVGYDMTAIFNLVPGLNYAYDLHRVTIVGDVTLSGATVTSLAGIVSVAVTKEQVLESVAAAPDGAFGVSKAQLLALVDDLLVPDVDLDGDGTPELVSMALAIDTNAATLEKVVGLDCPVCVP